MAKNISLICIIGLIFLLGCNGTVNTQPKLPIKNVVILGNSIVLHQPDSTLGWYGDWGMAASTKEKDFVHLLKARMEKINPKIELTYGSIATFERGYDTFNIETLSQYRNADLLILKISENVDPKDIKERNFKTHYNHLLNYLVSDNKTHVILSDGFWPSPVNSVIQEIALERKYAFVMLHDLFADSSMNARAFFTNVGVGNHPSDKGMEAIANRIWAKAKGILH